jgi:hypothetical protein
MPFVRPVPLFNYLLSLSSTVYSVNTIASVSFLLQWYRLCRQYQFSSSPFTPVGTIYTIRYRICSCISFGSSSTIISVNTICSSISFIPVATSCVNTICSSCLLYRGSGTSCTVNTICSNLLWLQCTVYAVNTICCQFPLLPVVPFIPSIPFCSSVSFCSVAPFIPSIPFDPVSPFSSCYQWPPSIPFDPYLCSVVPFIPSIPFVPVSPFMVAVYTSQYHLFQYLL